MAPAVTIQQLTNLPIIDPFDYTKITQVVLRTLEFVNVTSNSNQETNSPLLRLLAGYSRELDPHASSKRSDFTRIAWVDELQTWDLRFLHSRLSNAFLAIDCLVDRNRSASSSPDLLLSGPHEWIFTRSVNKTLIELKSNAEVSGDERKSDLRIRNILLNWKVRNGCFILIVKKNPDDLAAVVKNTPAQDEHQNENPTPRKKRKIMESATVHQYEAIILNSKDLSTVALIPLPSSLGHPEVNQLCLSYHGVWCCSLDEGGQVVTSPLITSNQTGWIVSSIVNAIYNHEPVDDISRFINAEMVKTTVPWVTLRSDDSESKSGDGSELNHQLIFRHISSFLAHFAPNCKSFDADHLLSPSWIVGFDLWSAAPGYQKAAEIALIGRQLFAALAISFSVKSEGFSRSLWPMIGAARWYAKLAQRIVSSVDPDSKSAHLAILPTTCCTFNFMFRLAMAMHHLYVWLQSMNLPPPHNNIHITQGQDHPKVSSINPRVSFQDEVQVARLVFLDVWDNSNPLRMEAWGKLMQEMGKMIQHGKLNEDPIQPIENFSVPLSALDSKQVEQSVELLRGLINSNQQLFKQKTSASTKISLNRTPTMQSTPTMNATASASLGGAEGVEGGLSTEEENNEKRLALIKEIGSKINVEEDRKKYDILTGAKLESLSPGSQSGIHPKKNQPIVKNKKSNGFSSSTHFKQCFKCKARSSIISWKPSNHKQDTNPTINQPDLISNQLDTGDDNHSLVIGQFDLSIKEFNRVCICGGLWVSPSSP